MKTVSLSPKITLSPSCACDKQPGTWTDSRWKLIWHSVQAPVMFILLSRTNNTNVCISSRSARPLRITELCIFLAGGRSQTPHRTLLCAMSQRRRRDTRRVRLTQRCADRSAYDVNVSKALCAFGSLSRYFDFIRRLVCAAPKSNTPTNIPLALWTWIDFTFLLSDSSWGL